MKAARAVTIIFAVAAVPLRAAEPPPPASAAPNVPAGVVEITLQNDNSRGLRWFEPAGVFVHPGQKVRWVSRNYHHSVTAYHPQSGRELRIPEGAKPFDETLGDGMRDYQESFEWTFDVPGTYDYYCRFHEAQGEIGRIVVGAPGGPATKPPGYAGAPEQLPGFVGLSSALLLPRVQRAFMHLDARNIAEHRKVSLPAELTQNGVAFHPRNARPVTVQK